MGQFYGNWGGAGWCDGRNVVYGDTIDWRGKAVDSVDAAFRTHDKAYNDLKDAYGASDKSGEAIAEYWRATINADQDLLRNLTDTSFDQS
jgi:hypothetical protein